MMSIASMARREAGVTWMLVAAVLVAIASVATQGFRFGVVNNEFHIPIALGYTALEQFSEDPFYAALASYTSAFWKLVSAVASAETAQLVFLVVHWLGRLLSLLALAALFWVAGFRRRIDLLLVMLAFSMSRAFAGTTYVGGHDLFGDYLTHTGFAWFLVFAQLALHANARTNWAFAVVGVAFNLNAFVGIWQGVVGALITIFARGVSTVRDRLTALWQPIAIALLVASPTLVWIMASQFGGGERSSFDFAVFLASYFPAHFFLQAAPVGALVQLLAKLLIGAGALLAVRPLLGVEGLRAARVVALALVGATALLTVGALLPLISSNRLLLDLHLLRADGFLQAFALIALLMWFLKAVSPLRPNDADGDRAAALLALVSVLLGQWVIAGAIVVSYLAAKRRRFIVATLVPILPTVLFFFDQALASGRDPAGWLLIGVAWLLATGAMFGRRAGMPAYGLIVAAVLALLVLLAATTDSHDPQGMVRTLLSFRYPALLCVLAAAVWLWSVIAGSALRGLNTAFPALAAVVVLVMTVGYSTAKALSGADRAEDQAQARDWAALTEWVREQTPVDAQFLVFARSYRALHWAAQRREWVNWKMGSAVMWAPEFYPTWSERYARYKAARTVEQRHALACSEGIDYLVFDSTACRDISSVHSIGRYCVVSADCEGSLQ
jgi:hypothetical protein